MSKLGLIGRRQRLIILQFSVDTERQHLSYASSIAARHDSHASSFLVVDILAGESSSARDRRGRYSRSPIHDPADDDRDVPKAGNLLIAMCPWDRVAVYPGSSAFWFAVNKLELLS